MTSSSNISDLFQLNFGTRIERSLGQTKAENKPNDIASKAVKDLISLSPMAKSTLTRQEIALAVLIPGSKVQKSNLNTTPDDSSKLNSIPNPVSKSSVNADAGETADQTISSVYLEAHSAVNDLTTPGGLRAAVEENPDILKQFLNNFSSDDAAAIKKAYQDNNLQLQDPSKVSGFVDTVTTSYTKFGQFGSTGQVGFTEGVPNDGLEYRFLDLGVAHLLVSWPKS